MLYRVVTRLTYRLNSLSTHDDKPLVLNKGDVVQGVSLGSVSKLDKRWMDKAIKRQQKNRLPGQPNLRMVFFKAHGVIRYANAIRELTPCRASGPTIPVEAED